MRNNSLMRLLAVPAVAAGLVLGAATMQKAAAEDVTYLLPAPAFLPG